MSYHARIVRRLNEVKHRRGFLSPAQRAILEFHSVLEAGEAPSRALMPKAGGRTDESRLAEIKRLRARLAELEAEDEDENEEESEGRTLGKDDHNDLGAPRYHGQSTPAHSERVGRADEAQKEFHRSYTQKLRESTHTGFQGVPKGF